MTREQQQEQFSIAYVRAVAAMAGFNTTELTVDDDSVDLGIAARGVQGIVRSPKLDLQLKCTATGVITGSHLAYQIPLKNYDDLRHTDHLVPRLLVIVSVPEDLATWLSQTDENLVLCHCGYWLSLYGQPEYVSVAKVPRKTVHVLRSQPFTAAALVEIMGRVGRKELL